MVVRVTTFNLENLFNRYALLDEPWENRNYEKLVMAVGVASIASRSGDLVSYETTDIQRNNTAQAILDSKPDILAVQEVENLITLRNFNAGYLDHYFDRIVLVDGNDPRGIDVGLLVREGFGGNILGIRTHVDETVDGSAVRRDARRNFGYMAQHALFSRDCLEVDIEVNGKILTFLVNHLKAQDGKETSIARRKTQAERVAVLARAASASGKVPVVLGDLNVAPDKDGSLQPLLSSPHLKDTCPKDAGGDSWTHYYVSGKSASRLDYILVGAGANVANTGIVRSGLTTKCKKFTGTRYPTIGQEHTESSDHCPVTVELSV